MVEFVPSPRIQSTDGNEQHPSEISIELDNSLYTSHTEGSGISDVNFKGLGFPRSSICLDGILFNVSSLSLSLPSRAVDLDIAYHYCVIPRQTKEIVHANDPKGFIQFIAFEFESQLTRIDTLAFRHISRLRSICLPRSVETICGGSFAECNNLSLLTFERGSRLTRIEGSPFSYCSSLNSVRLPASLQFLHHDAFPEVDAFQITIEESSRNFRVLGDFLMDIEGGTAVRYFGFRRTPTLFSEIETLEVGCFCGLLLLSSLVFERGSKLKRIEARALSHCLRLESICFPASVEILCAGCFQVRWALSSLAFEAESHLTEIEEKVFNGCADLASLSIPASVKKIHGSAFANSGISQFYIEEGNAHFALCGCFLINVQATSVVRYLGDQGEIALTFGPGLKLPRIEAGGFAHVSGLKSNFNSSVG
jgi:hypothetical protein